MHRVVAHCTEASLCAFWVARAGAPLAAEFAAASAFLCFGALLHFCVLGPYSIRWLRPSVSLPSLVRACCCLAFPWTSRATAAAMNQAHGRRRELHAQILGEFQDLGEEATLFEIAPEQTGVEDKSVNLVRLLGVELGIDERAQLGSRYR